MVAQDLDASLRIALADPPIQLPVVEIRPLTPADRGRLVDLFGRLSPTSVYQRFHQPVATVRAICLDYLLAVDGVDHVALAATYGDDIIGVARYHRPSRDEPAEAAIVVEDAWQRHGIGRRLLLALNDAAAANGLTELVGVTRTSNQALLGLVYDVFPGAEANIRFGEHVYDLRVPVG
jgi:GNAT superfamily N-acetyltransferase